ncbi:MAG: acylphosphatase [Candidatus Bipolaricaulota bacterium]|nr:acylphosphatase [Candidatus Bipolaricaulota bacterium]
MRARLEARVFGRVQGVFFRQNALAQARRLGLVGTVRNDPDGSVCVVAEGERPALEALADWLHRGPERAAVERVEATWLEPTSRYAEFRILR